MVAAAVARGTLARPSKARKQEAAKHKAAAGAVVCRQCAAAARPRRRELKPVRRQFYTRRRHPLRRACAEKITLSSMRNSTRYSSSLDGRVRLHSLENLYVRARAARLPLPPPQSPQLPPSAPPSSEATRWPPHEQPRLRLHSSYPATTPLGSLCPHQLSTTELHTLYLYTYPLMQTLNSLLFRHYILHCGATCSRRERRASAAWCAFVYLLPSKFISHIVVLGIFQAFHSR